MILNMFNEEIWRENPTTTMNSMKVSESIKMQNTYHGSYYPQKQSVNCVTHFDTRSETISMWDIIENCAVNDQPYPEWYAECGVRNELQQL